MRHVDPGATSPIVVAHLPINRRLEVRHARENPNAYTVWVVTPRLECPMLDKRGQARMFSTKDHALGTARTLAGILPSP